MKRLLWRVLIGVELAVLLYFGLALFLLSRNVIPRRHDLVHQCMAPAVALVNTRLAGGPAERDAPGDVPLDAHLDAIGAELPFALERKDPGGLPEPVRASLKAHGYAVDEVWDGTLYYHVLASGDVLALGPLDRIVRTEVTLLASLLVGMVLVVSLVSGLLAWPLIRDLRALERAVEGFGRGAFDGRARVRVAGAVAQLADGFNRMADKIERMVVGQRQLFAVVSHELRTPPARIRFTLELLEDTEDADERRAQIRSIDEDLTEIDQLLDELLTYLKLDTDAPPLERERFDAAEVLADLAARFEGLERRAEGSVAIEVRRDAAIEVHANRKYFRRAIENLLTNALRHARSCVRIDIAAESGGVVVRVADDGPGVPVSAREHIFQPFASLDESRSKRLGGIGLGLAIVRRIVAWHGGEVTVGDAEHPLGGAVFTTRWPA